MVGRRYHTLHLHGNNMAVVKLLVEKGAELDSKDAHGRTPLSYAAFMVQYERGEAAG